MLKLFEVKGFKNFKERITIDFSDVRDYKFNQQCISGNLLGKMIVYGKNSIGKSNLGLAIFDIVSHLTSNNVTPGLYDNYLNSSDDIDYAQFHYVFAFDNDEVDYYYLKDNKQYLIYEKVTINGILFYSYHYKNPSGIFIGVKEFAPTLNLTVKNVDCILRYIVNNTSADDSHPLRRMIKYVSNMLWFRSLDENRYIGYKTNTKDYIDFLSDDDNLAEFESFLHKSGIEENLIIIEEPDGSKKLYFDTDTPMPFFKVASSGTKALYTFFYWYKTTPEVSFMFIDEFDAYYHFELAEEIVDLLEKMSNTQIILTSHNTNLLTNKIMRPDCYFILTKDKLTSFANATDRELREGHNLEKLYMSGEFNAG